MIAKLGRIEPRECGIMFENRQHKSTLVMAGLVPAIHVFGVDGPQRRGCPASQTSLRSLRKSGLLWPGMTSY